MNKNPQEFCMGFAIGLFMGLVGFIVFGGISWLMGGEFRNGVMGVPVFVMGYLLLRHEFKK